ncbi:hypothetical protein [Pseudomonas sp. LRF_L74]|uniref:hypothetical protein n=1 Tax=Pseudomonas sp. LRF_L74 TaxID=3369422 RepID=UPI003F645B2C
MSEDPSAGSTDLHFLLEGRTRLAWTKRDYPPDSADYLERRVVAVPGDLRAHMLRITLALSEPGRTRLPGVLADLLIVLDGHGAALKARLLRSLAPLLDERLHALFTPCSLTPWSPALVALDGCVLGLGVSGDTQLEWPAAEESSCIHR